MIDFPTNHHVGGINFTLKLKREKEVEVHESRSMKNKEVMAKDAEVMNVISVIRMS